jgi:hypothetical protein
MKKCRSPQATIAYGGVLHPMQNFQQWKVHRITKNNNGNRVPHKTYQATSRTIIAMQMTPMELKEYAVIIHKDIRYKCQSCNGSTILQCDNCYTKINQLHTPIKEHVSNEYFSFDVSRKVDVPDVMSCNLTEQQAEQFSCAYFEFKRLHTLILNQIPQLLQQVQKPWIINSCLEKDGRGKDLFSVIRHNKLTHVEKVSLLHQLIQVIEYYCLLGYFITERQFYPIRDTHPKKDGESGIRKRKNRNSSSDVTSSDEEDSKKRKIDASGSDVSSSDEEESKKRKIDASGSDVSSSDEEESKKLTIHSIFEEASKQQFSHVKNVSMIPPSQLFTQILNPRVQQMGSLYYNPFKN